MIPTFLGTCTSIEHRMYTHPISVPKLRQCINSHSPTVPCSQYATKRGTCRREGNREEGRRKEGGSIFLSQHTPFTHQTCLQAHGVWPYITIGNRGEDRYRFQYSLFGLFNEPPYLASLPLAMHPCTFIWAEPSSNTSCLDNLPVTVSVQDEFKLTSLTNFPLPLNHSSNPQIPSWGLRTTHYIWVV